MVKSLVIVCGKEKLILKDPTNKIFDIKERSGSGIGGLNFEISKIWSIDVSGLLQSELDCPITKYMICEDAKCIKKSESKWHSINNSTVVLDSANGIEPSTKYLATITSGNVLSS